MLRHLTISALIAASCLLIFSCTSGMKEAKIMLATADSLINTDPDAALYSLMSIDSIIIPSLSDKDRAHYILLRTQARLMCGLDVRKDTAISEAVNFYHRKGSIHNYIKALSLRGDVHSQQKDFVSAIEDYKKAGRTLDEHGGNPLISGILHTRIAELYERTYVNDSLTIERYRKALECFQKSNRHDMVMNGRLSLARAQLTISPEDSYSNILTGAGLARQQQDSSMILVSMELETAYHLIKGQYQEVLRTARTALDEFSNNDDSDRGKTIANILLAYSTAYARSGHPDSARFIASLIPANSIDRFSMHMLYYDILRSEGDLEPALDHLLEGERLADSIRSAGYRLHLRDVEKRYETSRIKEQYSSMREKYISSYMTLLGILCVVAITGSFIYSRNIRLKREVEKCTDIIRNLNEEKESVGRNNSNIRNKESAIISEEMLKVTDELMEAYYKYGRTKVIADQVKAILQHHFPEEGTMAKVRRIVDASYPGFIPRLETEYPALKEKDIYIICLMACGFSTGTICALRRISESSLYVEKTRIARKIGGDIRLSDFIAKAIQDLKQS